ncbi:hypothetical protein GALMADRAFT_1140849 [Galerina marginata CBS 339.88]|uniref:Uncharacterized protein n=1 Tax=Galerina marginata (strain CBS 339.88) TaxID=685588 RepID=A0A067SA34_GALM3|nr:hypothetical protein GALMADRAFT_1140849 [Galerina marginata CBS 339.88]
MALHRGGGLGHEEGRGKLDFSTLRRRPVSRILSPLILELFSLIYSIVFVVRPSPLSTFIFGFFLHGFSTPVTTVASGNVEWSRATTMAYDPTNTTNWLDLFSGVSNSGEMRHDTPPATQACSSGTTPAPPVIGVWNTGGVDSHLPAPVRKNHRFHSALPPRRRGAISGLNFFFLFCRLLPFLRLSNFILPSFVVLYLSVLFRRPTLLRAFVMAFKCL